MNDFLNNILNSIGGFFNSFGWKIVMVICILVVAFLVIKLISFILKKILYKTKIDNAVVSFVVSLNKLLIWSLIIIVIAGLLELSVSSILVAFSSVALALGLALKESLASLANGILIIINKPFRRGDHVSVNGVEGKIHNIKLLTTEVITFNNELMILPNSSIINNTLINYTACPTRRLDLVYSVAYDSDMNFVETTLRDVIKNESRIMNTPEPACYMSSHSASSVDYTLKIWVKTSDYWDVKFAMGRKVFDAFKEANIEIPYSQLDVHIKNDAEVKSIDKGEKSNAKQKTK